MSKITVSAEINGSEVAEQLSNEIKNNGIVLNEGTFNVKAFVVSKSEKEVEVELSKIRFILTRN